ncbi:MAG TPA: histidinol dehydrogenase [Verrucomicrobiota bacterium]|nr:histidinol dehydrogenase [Verrucomicrobiota bacterium]HNT14762.1 histidinol dehydrogenase [Verrucomicrobiota bacterium]
MKVLRHTDRQFARELARIAASASLFDPVIEQRTRAIVAAVAARGDAALLDFTEQFDGAKLTAQQLPVTREELLAASLKAGRPLRAAIAAARLNIARFARKSRRKSWHARNSHGAVVGEKFDPFARVGIYVPGGTAPLASTALMTITLAREAGCREIVVCSPCGKDGGLNPTIVFAARAAGATEIYRVGGAQAIAALAYGTETIRRVQKIFGPGNAYVSMAKRLLFGHVAVDLLAGPSELLVLADDSADARFIAADLLAQAEHGSGHERIWLVTTSRQLLGAVEREISRQFPALSRRKMVQRVLDRNAWLILVKTMAEGVALTNRLAPEHCEVIARRARAVSRGITTAGALFLGNYSPTVLGDYVAGPSHVLPTDGAGVSFAGLTVDQFQRRTSVVEYSRAGLRRALPAVRQFAALEGLDGHGKSAEVRF